MSLADFYSGRADKKQAGIDGLEFGFADRLYEMLLSLPPEMRGQVTILSAYRSYEHQQELFNNAVKKYGSEAAARKWVAPPGKSNHNGGLAVDLTFHTPQSREWVHANARRFGLEFPMSHENWHIEPLGKRTGEYKPSGKTWGGAPFSYKQGRTADKHGHGGDFSGYDPDGDDAYTDDDIPTVDNGSVETQLMRVADLVRGGVASAKQFRINSGAQTMADRNIGTYKEKS